MKLRQIEKISFNRVIAVLGICTFIALFFFAQQYFYAYNFDKKFHFWSELTYEIICAYSWGILFIFIIRLAKKYRLEKNSWLHNLPIHIFAAIIISLIHRVVTSIPHLYLFYPEKFAKVDVSLLTAKTVSSAFDSFVTYWLILGVYYGFDYYRQYRESKINEAELQKQLAQANLHALKMQLHPHFLFNTLHAVSTLMQDDIKAARKMLAKLSDLLRTTLDNIGIQEVEFGKELEFLKSYLAIEKIRFQDRLKIIYKIDPSTMSAKVPNLILQPLVENSIKHGIADKVEGGKIIVSSRRDNELLILTVSDDGKNNRKKINEGIGLSNTRARLLQLYGENFSMKITSDKDTGFKVTLVFPFIEFEPVNDE